MTRTSAQRRPNWIPSLAEMLFVATMAWLFLGSGPSALLIDGDTGWHIRTGDYILATHSFPKQDLFSFSRAGQPWFAWEWMSDVIFSALHRMSGLAGVALLTGVLIAGASAIMFRFMIWQGSDLLVAVMMVLIATSASTVHWLARPHIFSYFFMTIAVWLLDADRRSQTPWVFALVGLSAIWTNIHGAFIALLITLGIYLAGSAAETLWEPAGTRNWNRTRRYGLLLGLASAATLLNPYTYHLHQHIFQYLRSDFILQHVAEFQSPDFRGGGMRYFEVLLFAGLVCVPALLKRRDLTRALLIVAWAHASLLSGRHVLLYVVVAAPLVAQEVTWLWERAAKAGIEWVAILKAVASDYGSGGYGTSAQAKQRPAIAWLTPVFVLGIGATLLAGQNVEKLRSEFSKELFPVEACRSAGGSLAGHRILTSDQWGDYLIYRYYPNIKVFIDGRSDFYGAEFGEEYLQLMHSDYRWASIIDRYGFDLALLPSQWSLATTMKASPEWKVKYDDGKALLLERVSGPTRAAANPSAGAEKGSSKN